MIDAAGDHSGFTFPVDPGPINLGHMFQDQLIFRKGGIASYLLLNSFILACSSKGKAEEANWQKFGVMVNL